MTTDEGEKTATDFKTLEGYTFEKPTPENTWIQFSAGDVEMLHISATECRVRGEVVATGAEAFDALKEWMRTVIEQQENAQLHAWVADAVLAMRQVTLHTADCADGGFGHVCTCHVGTIERVLASTPKMGK